MFGRVCAFLAKLSRIRAGRFLPVVVSLSLITGLAVSAQASPPGPAPQAPTTVASQPQEPPKPVIPEVKRGQGKDPDQHGKSTWKYQQPQPAAGVATGSPYLRIDMESKTYYGPDTYICWDTAYVNLVQGSQYFICAVVFPYDANGNPASFSSSNTFEFIIKDGCGNTVSDVTRYNLYTAGTNPAVLTAMQNGFELGVAIGSGVFGVPWDSSCSTGWSMTVNFSGSTTDPTPVPVNSTATVIGNTTPPAPPPPMPAEQTTGDGAPYHSEQGDPVDSLTGAFNYHPDRIDLGYAALGGGVALGRSYSSAAQRSNRFGPGWSDSYDATLQADPTTGKVTYHDPGGSVQVFTPAGGSYYTSPLGVRSTLVTTPTGWTLTTKTQMVLTFDLNGRLTGTRDRNGQGTVLNWTGGQLVSVTGSGRTISFSYNPSGLVSEVTGSDGRTAGYQYDALGRLQTFTDVMGKVTTYGYDGNSLLASVQDANSNFPIRSTYDPNTRRVIQQQDANGQISTFGWTQTGADAGTGTATVTDPRGFTINDTYQNGYLVAQADGDGKVSHFVWDESAQLKQFYDRLGISTYFSYDSAGNLAWRKSPTDGYTETYAHNSSNDVTSATDFNGNTSTYTYDPAGNLASVSRPSIAGGTTPVTSASYVYNPNGTLQTSTDALGYTTQYSYDSQGDLTSATSPEGRITSYTIDSAGRVTSIVEPRGNVTGANPDTYRTTQTWDNLDRITKVTDPLGHATQAFYDPAGRLDHTLDAKGGTTSYTYSATGKPLTIQGPDLAVGPQRYTYDPNDNVATATSPAGVTTSYTYTSSNAVRTVSSTGTGTWTYDHDADGRITKATAPSGRSVTMTRTAKGHVSQVSYSDSTPAVSYTYDANGNRKTMTDARGTTTYAYNAINQVTSASLGSTSFTYSYDQASQLIRRTLPDGSAATQYAYDKDGRLKTVTSGTTTLASYAYAPATGTVTTTLPGSITNTLQIDAAGRAASTQALKGSTVLTRSQYTLDELGNPTQIVNADGTTDSYAYSPLSRLAAACYGATSCTSTTPTAAFRFSYDGDGNTTSVMQPAGTTNYTYNSAGRVTGRSGLKGTATYQYDADGNTISDGTSSYTWNAASQLTAVTAGSNTTSYTYDGDNHRVSTTASRTTTTNSYDTLTGQIVLEQSSRSTLRKYDYGIGLLSTTAGNSIYSYLTDALGSVRGVATSTGTLSLGYSYNPYGDSRATTSGKSSPTNPLQFTGGYLTGALYQLGARDYSSTDGRFLTPDPAGVPGRGYSYAASNPLAFTDPTGLSEHDWRKMINELANGVANVAGTIALVCAIAVVCAEISPIAGGISLAASAVEVLTSDQTASCVSGHGSCPEAIVNAAIVSTAGKFGPAGKEAANGIKALAGAGDTFLYQKLSSAGEHLKYGIAKNPATRYTSSELAGGELNILAKGSRQEMLSLERSLHETLPIGPEEGQLFYIQKQIENGLRPPPYPW